MKKKRSNSAMDENDLTSNFDVDAIFYSAADHDAIGDRIWDDMVARRRLDDLQEHEAQNLLKNSPVDP